MFRFLHVLMLNAWRGVRRANGTPAIFTVLVAICVLFIGSNASARSSIRTAMQVVGLPVSFVPESSDVTVSNSGGSGSNERSFDKKSDSNKNNDHTVYSSKSTSISGTDGAANQTPQALTASVSLDPPAVTPVCSQGMMLYNVQTAQLTLSAITAAAGSFSWQWDTRIDDGSNDGTPPLNTAIHKQDYDAGVQIVQLSSKDPSQPLVSAPANTNYAYSFRLDIDGSVIADSPWISVPEATGSTCPS